MKKLFLIHILLLCVSFDIYAQPEKIYYNLNWDVADSNDYEYYIELTKSDKNEYKSFYKTGETRSLFYCTEFNYEAIAKSKFISICVARSPKFNFSRWVISLKTSSWASISTVR